ncbi:MAG: TonB-dependent receptor [Bacteroidota bacterium]|nr:TonB-dependent receptor [Rhodothermia bacterium]MCS7155655.1 TonB-dependent receptor [Bacteroidota bacterium]MDW8137205.1 TonB-dependent receptor [Bacteroidota bacterium]MDW8284925.1 TonB-dependent receptor [Bacteroidota bacterium]
MKRLILPRRAFGIALWALLLSFAQSRAQVRTALLEGRVVDRDTGEGLGWTSVLLVELNRSATAHEDGRFEIAHVPPGSYTLRAFRIGYHSVTLRVEVQVPRTTVEIRMASTAVMMQTVEVAADLEARKGLAGSLGDVIHGVRLRQSLARTLAETLSGEPGLASAGMGPATVQPVLRGLGGYRLTILEDGAGTGDLSAMSLDHAVAVDPLQAERIEILRGPEALLYGSKALTGVINVVRGAIPMERTDHLHGSVSLQGESVNWGLAGGVGLWFPALKGTGRVDASVRSAADVRTPSGRLRNTALQTATGSVGWGIDRPWGTLGGALILYGSRYGIPGGFVGAHPEGVTVEMDRVQLASQGEFNLPWVAWSRLQLKQDLTLFRLRELESKGLIGSEFAQFTYQVRAITRQRRWGPLRNGALGVEAGYRDRWAALGSSTPDLWEFNLAAAAYQEWSRGLWIVRAALRADGRWISPYRERISRTIGLMRARQFADLSASIALAYVLPAGLDLSLGLVRAFRPPEPEELYSEGPHLATYSFEVGNPQLDGEVGHGAELSLRWNRPGMRLRLTGFGNRIRGYIFPRNTGRISARTLLPIYQYMGTDALLWGGEGALEWRPLANWGLFASSSWVWGGFADTRKPLPMIPPVMGRLELHYGSGALSALLGLRFAMRQERVDVFEEPTPGYAVLDASVQYYWSGGALLHTLVLGLQNLTDAAYRNHLSRVKRIMPEPGRNLRLLYRVYF